MPFIQEKFDEISGSKFFTVLDLTSGYWQFGLKEDSKKWTAFRTHAGTFEFQRMPFGLCNAGATFQRAMDKMIGISNAQAYIDDDHLKHLRLVFERLLAANLKAKTTKCQFCKPETKYLGFVVNENGVKVDPEKIEAILKIQAPTTKRQVKQFLGVGSYYRKFIPNFADLAEPLINLTRKSQVFRWTKACDISFNNIKQRLTNTPVLVYPDLTGAKTFYVITDASAYGLGAVLTQLDDNGDEKAICYASRSLTTAERKWSPIEREMLAIVWAVKHFRMYLAALWFVVITDHKPLIKWDKMDMVSERMGNLISKLQEYKFDIEHRSGVNNQVADALSRIGSESTDILEQSVEIKDEEIVVEYFLSKIDALLAASSEINRLPRIESKEEMETRMRTVIDLSQKAQEIVMAYAGIGELTEKKEERSRLFKYIDTLIEIQIKKMRALIPLDVWNKIDVSSPRMKYMENVMKRYLASPSKRDEEKIISSVEKSSKASNVNNEERPKFKRIEKPKELDEVGEEPEFFTIQEKEMLVKTMMQDIEKIQELQANDVSIRVARLGAEHKNPKFKNYVVRQGLVYYEDKKGTKEYEKHTRLLLCLPTSMQDAALRACHDDMAGGHLGEKKTYAKLKE